MNKNRFIHKLEGTELLPFETLNKTQKAFVLENFQSLPHTDYYYQLNVSGLVISRTHKFNVRKEEQFI